MLKNKISPISKVLKKALYLIEKGFCKGAYVRNKNGYIDELYENESDSHCILGAIKYANNHKCKDPYRPSYHIQQRELKIINLLHKHLPKIEDEYDVPGRIIAFSDNYCDQNMATNFIKYMITVAEINEKERNKEW